MTLVVTAVQGLGMKESLLIRKDKNMYFEIYNDAKGEFRWRLKAGNHEIVATGGEGYKTKQGCQKGIDSVKKITADTEVKDLTK